MIQFTQRGPKVNGVQYKATYQKYKDMEGKEYIQIYSRNYGSFYFPEEIRAQFQVENRTDSMTDYFEMDRFNVCQEHELFPKVKATLEAINASYNKRKEKKKSERHLPKVSRCKSPKPFHHEYVSKIRFPELGKIVYLSCVLKKQEAIKAAQAVLMLTENANFKIVVC
ncbi:MULTISPECIES: hypothetical protein [Leptospira]|uniref:Uncharacterized protein n=3 Tax=Leptospira interrogans TaxID=173 RepID=A0A0E2CZ00_LEPIR|nr:MULTISPECIES: hypothetical protein [Leptospira]EKR52835.1 hypothetical protein LEP1GSC105_0027 [Leptospira interrogans str. UI 12758]EMJ38739.1 hypothetical protein LEP1GSC079_0046 [Leptospira interrogans str. FPW1039]EMN34610.1 hypothetical protein LEP1GSC084_0005 [Leptospira interrogans serovar Medanensis str. L0448]EMN93909.1 hypothetical protein LEP1GSC110_0169 [Leptospira interrogans serovar Medanensis str. UT053]KGE27695.1 hypothetical protein IQ65_05155 [Leptospira interrogans serova